MNVGPDDRFAAAADVHARAFDGETVIVDLKRGDYFGLNDLGARFWDGALQGKSARQVAESLEGMFEVTGERLLADLVALAGELVDRGLLVLKSP
ncbi:MAG: PqqD family protein [Myxococcales bacterium]|nr:PqqD family protein [Myxococcales bacterium]